MKPYYQDDAAQIFLGDCRDILPHLPKVDLVLTSPPYDSLRDYGGQVWDFESVAESLLLSLMPGSVMVWVVGDETKNGSESGSSFRQALWFMEHGLNLHDTMIYAKNGPPYPSQNRYFQVFEYMFIFSKGEPKTVNLIKDRKNRWAGGKWSSGRSKRTKAGELTYDPQLDWNVKEFGVRFNIWEYNTGYGYSAEADYIYEHPAIFPPALAKDHIESWSNPNDIVLDPLMGSGTTLRAAKDLGRKAIGIEIEEKYCEIAAKRMSQSVMQL